MRHYPPQDKRDYAERRTTFILSLKEFFKFCVIGNVYLQSIEYKENVYCTGKWRKAVKNSQSININVYLILIFVLITLVYFLLSEVYYIVDKMCVYE